MIGLDFSFSDLVRDTRDVLLADSDIATYCQNEFGKNFQLSIGNDSRDEWGESQAPFIQIIPTSTQTGISEQDPTVALDVDLGIVYGVGDDSDYTDPQGLGTFEFEGFYRLDGLREMVEKALQNAASSRNAVVDFITVTYDNSNYLPLHVATMTVEFRLPGVLSGRLPL